MTLTGARTGIFESTRVILGGFDSHFRVAVTNTHWKSNGHENERGSEPKDSLPVRRRQRVTKVSHPRGSGERRAARRLLLLAFCTFLF